MLEKADVPFILISPYTNGKVVQDQRRAYIPSKCSLHDLAVMIESLCKEHERTKWLGKLAAMLIIMKDDEEDERQH